MAPVSFTARLYMVGGSLCIVVPDKIRDDFGFGCDQVVIVTIATIEEEEEG